MLIGRTLGHYVIKSSLGAGGMGEVYRATDTKLGRDVALKILPSHLASSAERRERFQREARALAALDHPRIVAIHSLEEVDGADLLTMELVEGRSLDRLIPPGGLSVEQVVQIGADIADALSAAHEKGIMLRDLKPANIMVTSAGSAKVLDFGLAKLAAESPDADRLLTEMQTGAGVVMGTGSYMSPRAITPGGGTRA
jgi:serine/threonine protein kinase